MIFIRYLCLIVLVSLFNSACSIAEQKKQHHQKNETDLNVSVEIKQLLTKEMLAIEKGMQELVTTIATADWQRTVKIGQQIQASYLLKQNLTADQMKHLHQVLPDQFIALDHLFHRYAGMLAHAAEVKNTDVVNFYFYKMNESCVQCHSLFAKSKFVGFSGETINHH